MVAAGPIIAYLYPASRLVANSRYGFAKGKLVNGLKDPRGRGLRIDNAVQCGKQMERSWNPWNKAEFIHLEFYEFYSLDLSTVESSNDPALLTGACLVANEGMIHFITYNNYQ